MTKLNFVFCPTGLWNHSFAGKIEQGECPAEAARRELEEESGLVVQPDQLEKVGYFEYEFEDGRIMGKIMAMHIYRAVSWAGEGAVPVSSCCTSPMWVTRWRPPAG